jgi:P4 family phage/plasmid primase-like protien
MYKRGEFCGYIQRYKVEKGSEFTHTSIVKPSGAFYVPTDEMDTFYDVYKRALKAGEDLYMTEKHRDISPILIDLDFKFEKKDEIARIYSREVIENVIKAYVRKIGEYVNVPDQYEIYLLEKPYPSVDKGLVKDGVHIIIPGITTKTSVQFLVRKDLLNEMKEILAHMNCVNSIDDIVDEAVIERNNWQMYGSKKPNCECYKVTHQYIWNSSDSTLTENVTSASNASNADLVEILSIRNKYDANSIKIEKHDIVKEFEKEASSKHKKKMSNALQTTINTKKNQIENLEHISRLVDVLSEDRASNYLDWISVGWCLRNIDHRLLDKWIEFSKKSSKFEDGECEKKWNYMRDDGLGMGTLNMWAKKDNPDQYAEIMKQDISTLIYTSRNETHYDIARVVHFMFKHEFVCASIKSNYWYQYRENRWVPCDCGYSLNGKLSTEVFKRYSAAASDYHARASATESETEQSIFSEIGKKLGAIATKLKNGPFKENVMSECRRLFYLEKFEEKLDGKCHLIGFENGVYDLEIKEFREGRPEDYISFSTGCNYVEYDSTNHYVQQLNKFLSTVLTKDHIREYVMLLLSSFLNGNIREERFHIWTGSGSNGKSKIIDLFEQSFGDYCCKFPVTLLTQKRAASNAANSELARAKGKRFAVLQEPSEDEKLNVGLMKELSGGDKILARALFKEAFEFKPQFKMVLTCNQLPNVPSDDGGTWRRIRLVEFTSKFVQDPDPEKPNEFPMDTELSTKFVDWREQFMSLLIEYYKKYTVTGIKEPEEVLQCTKEYQKNNDFYLEFKDDKIETNEMGFLSVNDAYSLFKYWQKENGSSIKIKKRDFMIAIDKMCGKRVNVSRVEGWKGYRIKSDGGLGDDDNDDMN